jgi:hypothetical protein
MMVYVLDMGPYIEYMDIIILDTNTKVIIIIYLKKGMLLKFLVHIL